MHETIQLSQLSDDTMVFQAEETVKSAGELKDSILKGYEKRTTDWYVGIPTKWIPNAEHMFENYIENEAEELWEDADEAMHDRIDPLIPQIQAILDAVEIPYYKCGASIEIDIVPMRSETNE